MSNPAPPFELLLRPPKRIRRAAFLIDCDNASHRQIDRAIQIASAEADLIFRRAYADWTHNSNLPWKPVCASYAIQPVQAHAHVPGKNTTDIALTIDAIELCLTEAIDAVCIVSGDSDFTALALRLRERGIWVLGIGTGGSESYAFRHACDRFVSIDPVAATASTHPTQAPQPTVPKPPVPESPSTLADDTAERAGLRPPAPRPAWTKLIQDACDQMGDKEGWILLSRAGAYAKKSHPDFDPKHYKAPKLLNLIETRPDLFEITHQLGSDGSPPHPVIRRIDNRGDSQDLFKPTPQPRW